MSARIAMRARGRRGRFPATDAHDRKERFSEYGKEVKRRAYGNWEMVLRTLAPMLHPALDVGPRKHVACPVHGGVHGDAFRLLSDFNMTGGTVCNTCGTHHDGFNTLKWLYGWDFARAVKEVGEVVGLRYGNGQVAETSPVVKTVAVPMAKEEDPETVRRRDEKRAADMAQLWAESYSIFAPEAAIAREYLKRRGITRVFGPLEDLRFHPALPYWENRTSVADYPGMLRMLRQKDGRTLTIERLYLTPEGLKAPVEKQKKVMPRLSTGEYHGSAVRLDHDVGLVLCVAEGVETALSFRALTGFPTWATTVANLMESLVIPNQVELVVIAADADRPQRDAQGRELPPRGQAAAEVLAQRIRAAGRKVVILPPPFVVPEGRHKLDWNDVLVEMGIDEGRQIPMVQKLRSKVEQELTAMGYDWREASRVSY